MTMSDVLNAANISRDITGNSSGAVAFVQGGIAVVDRLNVAEVPPAQDSCLDQVIQDCAGHRAIYFQLIRDRDRRFADRALVLEELHDPFLFHGARAAGEHTGLLW